MNVMRFEWDETKNKSNIKKHGIDFLLAAEAFDDAGHVTILDDAHDFEVRWSLIGFTLAMNLVVVVHVFRDRFGEDVVRIISARPATRHERNFYARENGQL
jgi:uncharacterized protein